MTHNDLARYRALLANHKSNTGFAQTLRIKWYELESLVDEISELRSDQNQKPELHETPKGIDIHRDFGTE